MDSDIIELSSLDFNDGPSSGPRKTNFGGGIELLMNDKVKEGSKNQISDIDIDDLEHIENEFNELVNEDELTSSFSKSDLFSSSVDKVNDDLEEKHSVRFSETPSLGKATAETESDKKTWDGFTKFNNIPINPDKALPAEPKMSKEETLREKFKYLRKLEALEKKGVELSKKYTMESSLTEMQGEYETIMDEKSKQNSIKFQGNMMMAVINGLEFLNNKFDPFDIKLEGWSDQVNENLTDYDEIFGELHEKYKSKASMAPELKLLFQLGGSAMMVHMSNTLFKSAMPGMDDILRQNPDLMRSFQNAAVNSMAQTSPGFSGFMSNMMNPEPSPSYGRGPPPPLATQGPNAVPTPITRPGNNNYSSRPDISMGRNNFSEEAVNVKDNFSRADQTERTQRSTRPEMKGPSDLSDILSGLKTKTINIQEAGQPQSSSSASAPSLNDSSTISISDLKELQSDANMPKRSKRRQKSSSNTISLDI